MKSNSITFDPGYYKNERPEIAKLIEADMRLIIDVGCGAGNLGNRLKQELPSRSVVGIECLEAPAREAATKLDKVLVGDVQTMRIDLQPGSFDCVIFADVLEHLPQPLDVLRKFRPLLRPNGAVICSIPNMRHYTVILRLIRRGWVYDSFGHFDNTHLRFFSLASMKSLIKEAGYEIDLIIPRVVASRKFRLINMLLLGSLSEFVAFQYLIRARKRAS